MDIILPQPNLKGNISIEECIFKRESIRKYKPNQPIDDNSLSQIFWAAQGKKDRKKTVPSAGATYPLEIYATIKNKGFFHYKVDKHLLEFIRAEDLSKDLALASWNQTFIEEAYLNIIICAEYQRTCQRYGDRGIRYVFMEVGHCAQNVHLIAIAEGLDSVPIGAFNDERVKNLLNLPKEIEPLYIIPIGYRK